MTASLAGAIAAIERSAVVHLDAFGDVIEAAIAEDRELDDVEIARLRLMRTQFLRAVAVIETVCEGRAPDGGQHD